MMHIPRQNHLWGHEMSTRCKAPLAFISELILALQHEMFIFFSPGGMGGAHSGEYLEETAVLNINFLSICPQKEIFGDL